MNRPERGRPDFWSRRGSIPSSQSIRKCRPIVTPPSTQVSTRPPPTRPPPTRPRSVWTGCPAGKHSVCHSRSGSPTSKRGRGPPLGLPFRGLPLRDLPLPPDLLRQPRLPRRSGFPPRRVPPRSTSPRGDRRLPSATRRSVATRSRPEAPSPVRDRQPDVDRTTEVRRAAVKRTTAVDSSGKVSFKIGSGRIFRGVWSSDSKTSAPLSRRMSDSDGQAGTPPNVEATLLKRPVSPSAGRRGPAESASGDEATNTAPPPGRSPRRAGRCTTVSARSPSHTRRPDRPPGRRRP